MRADVPEKVASGGGENMERQSGRQGWSGKGGLPQTQVQGQDTRAGGLSCPGVELAGAE